MGNMVCSGATLQCSFGTTPSAFAASGLDCDATSLAGVVTDIGPDNGGTRLGVSSPPPSAVDSRPPWNFLLPTERGSPRQNEREWPSILRLVQNRLGWPTKLRHGQRTAGNGQLVP